MGYVPSVPGFVRPRFCPRERGGMMSILELRQKAELGSVVAQSMLGICYLNGIDVEVDYGEAFRLLSEAADKGASRAIVNLARMYGEGLGVSKNPVESIRLYEVAATAGEFFAQVALGRIYSRGESVPISSDSALRWYSAAAAQSDRVADCEELREAKEYVASVHG